MANKLEKYRTSIDKTKRVVCDVIPGVRSYGYNLTVSHAQKLLWFRVSKVGTRTMLHELEKSGVKLENTHQRFIPYSREIYENYLKVAFVRNPWDRLVSCWKNKVVDSNSFGLEKELYLQLQEFSAFIEFISQLNIDKTDIHIRRQSAMMDYENIDFLGRFETYEVDVVKLFELIGFEKHNVANKNESSMGNISYRKFYSAQDKCIVGDLYAKDIELFNYEY